VNQTQLLQLGQRHQHLLHNGPDAVERQRRELVLFQKVVQVLLQHFEHQTRVVLVLEALKGAHKVVLLGILHAQPRQDADFDLTLARVGRVLLQDFDGHNVVGALLPALDHLAKRALAQKLQHFVLVVGRDEHFVLNQLVLALVRRTTLFGCGCGGVVGRPAFVLLSNRCC